MLRDTGIFWSVMVCHITRSPSLGGGKKADDQQRVKSAEGFGSVTAGGWLVLFCIRVRASI